MTIIRSGKIAGSRATESIEPGGVAVAKPSGAATLDGAGQAVVSNPKAGHRWPRSAKRLLLVALLVVAGGIAGFLLLRPVVVTVSQVAHRDIAPAIQGVGTVEAKVAVQVGSKITGRVVAVLVDQGDTVIARQVLARLDDAQQRAEVARQEAALRAAAAAVAEAQANVRRAQSTLDDLVAGSRPAEIEQLRERVKSAGATRSSSSPTRSPHGSPCTWTSETPRGWHAGIPRTSSFARCLSGCTVGGSPASSAKATASPSSSPWISASMNSPAASRSASRWRQRSGLPFTTMWRPFRSRPSSGDPMAAVIAVTHDERMIEGFDRVYHMIDGRTDKSWRPSQPAIDGE